MLNKPTYGVNWDLAQKISLTSRRELWLIPGNGFLCFLWLPAGGALRQACAPTRIAVNSGLAAVTLSGSSTHVNRFMIGVAPDQAKRVLVHTGELVKTRPIGSGRIFTLRDSVNNPPDRLTFRG